MRLRPLSFAVALLLVGCQTPTLFMSATNFYTLERGITKQQFLDGWQRSTDALHLPNGKPSTSQTFRSGSDVWEVWIYSLWRNDVAGQVVDHQEYVAFKNGPLEEWGLGTLPLTLRDNPNRVDVHVDH